MHKMPVSDLKGCKTNKDSVLKEWYNKRDKSLSKKNKGENHEQIK